VALKDQAVFNLFGDATLEERQRILDLHRQNPGINRRERISLLLDKGLGRKASADILDRMFDRFSSLVWDGLMTCPEVPGVRGFLDTLRFTPCYVVSAAPQEEVRAVACARDFSKYFVDILGTPPSKAELLLEIMRREKVRSESMLFIGDKISDFKAALEAGVSFLGRKCPQQPTDFPVGVQIVDFRADKVKLMNILKET
jgi:phosphoglycolate phosphatase